MLKVLEFSLYISYISLVLNDGILRSCDIISNDRSSCDIISDYIIVCQCAVMMSVWLMAGHRDLQCITFFIFYGLCLYICSRLSLDSEADMKHFNMFAICTTCLMIICHFACMTLFFCFFTK